MDDAQTSAQVGWKTIGLPLRRGDAHITRQQARSQVHIAHLQALGQLRRGREFRVKTHITALIAVIHFVEAQQSGMRQNLAHEQHLAPARVAQHHIGRPALCRLALHTLGGSLPPDDGGFGVDQPRMNLGRTAALGLVNHMMHPGHHGFLAHRQGTHIMSGLLQGRSQLTKLARKILVNQQNFHGFTLLFGAIQASKHGQTTAPEFSSFGSLSFLIGLIKSSRWMPSHMAMAAATNTDE